VNGETGMMKLIYCLQNIYKTAMVRINSLKGGISIIWKLLPNGTVLYG